jgi:fibronectin-binding autotransporter adhesin
MAQITGSLAATNCTFLLNTNEGGGGGALDVYLATATIANCSFVSNNATFGGGLINYGTVAITNCTFNGNSAVFGGGIENEGTTAVRNTIIAGNTASALGGDCYGAFVSGGYNLIGASEGSSGWNGLADQVGFTNAPLDALLGPLQDNGGFTPTMAPLPGSLAIDQGNSSSIRIDQRGRPRPYTNNPFASIPVGGDHSEIGAVELNYFPSIVVTKLNDHGDGSLRQAVAEVSSNGVIRFAAGLAGTIVLTSGEIDAFHKGFSLQGPGTRTLTVSGNNSGRVFSLYDGTFNFSGLTLANGVNTGQTSGRAGNLAISYPTVVNLQQCRITGGRSLEGAGIWNAGMLTMTACTLDNNFATNYGGGIFNYSLGNLLMTNCTVALNGAAQDGGVYTEGRGVARNCTFAFNSASVSKGGIVSGGGTFYLGGSLIASNTAPSAPDVFGPFFSDGYNLIGNTTGGAGFGGPNDQLDVAALIGPLGDYGGPTPTIALRAGSPAIDKGHDFGLATDQRGFARTLDTPSVPNANGGADIGAFEVDPSFRIVDVQRVGTDVALNLMTVLGRNYRAEYTNNLAPGNWTIFSNNVPGNGYLLWVTNYGGATQPRRFYRGAIVP